MIFPSLSSIRSSISYQCLLVRLSLSASLASCSHLMRGFRRLLSRGKSGNLPTLRRCLRSYRAHAFCQWTLRLTVVMLIVAFIAWGTVRCFMMALHIQ